jgi:hypothetical protein
MRVVALEAQAALAELLEGVAVQGETHKRQSLEVLMLQLTVVLAARAGTPQSTVVWLVLGALAVTRLATVI